MNLTLLALIGLACSLGLALNTVILLIIAGFHKGKITLDFGRFHEYWTEV